MVSLDVKYDIPPSPSPNVSTSPKTNHAPIAAGSLPTWNNLSPPYLHEIFQSLSRLKTALNEMTNLNADTTFPAQIAQSITNATNEQDGNEKTENAQKSTRPKSSVLPLQRREIARAQLKSLKQQLGVGEGWKARVKGELGDMREELMEGVGRLGD